MPASRSPGTNCSRRWRVLAACAPYLANAETFTGSGPLAAAAELQKDTAHAQGLDHPAMINATKVRRPRSDAAERYAWSNAQRPPAAQVSKLRARQGGRWLPSPPLCANVRPLPSSGFVGKLVRRHQWIRDLHPRTVKAIGWSDHLSRRALGSVPMSDAGSGSQPSKIPGVPINHRSDWTGCPGSRFSAKLLRQ